MKRVVYRLYKQCSQTNYTRGYQGYQGALGETGYQGSQGSAGTYSVDSGVRGDQGAQGFPGVNGLDGDVGYVGIDGYMGVDGLTGAQGCDGSEGYIGEQGVTGIQGYTGSIGPIGFMGGIGLNGLAGSVGSTGTDGFIGVDGVTGVDGFIGVDGVTGVDGFIGVDGVTGVDGNEGWMGIIGLEGHVGAQGVTGEQGFTGVAGVVGVIGNTGGVGGNGIEGVVGEQGNIGVFGSTGFDGSVGVQGATGYDGVNGLVGSTGAQGVDGLVGVIGAQGVTGYDGEVGVAGSDGLVGSIGEQGVTGWDGIIGSQGAQGNILVVVGAQGDTGAQGVTGFIGSQGSQGAQGDTGSRGAQGVTGAVGAQGVNVFDIGLTGSLGVQGVTGITGSQGNQGVAGVNASDGPQGNVGYGNYGGATGEQGSNYISQYATQIMSIAPYTSTALTVSDVGKWTGLESNCGWTSSASSIVLPDPNSVVTGSVVGLVNVTYGANINVLNYDGTTMFYGGTYLPRMSYLTGYLFMNMQTYGSQTNQWNVVNRSNTINAGNLSISIGSSASTTVPYKTSTTYTVENYTVIVIYSSSSSVLKLSITGSGTVGYYIVGGGAGGGGGSACGTSNVNAKGCGGCGGCGGQIKTGVVSLSSSYTSSTDTLGSGGGTSNGAKVTSNVSSLGNVGKNGSATTVFGISASGGVAPSVAAPVSVTTNVLYATLPTPTGNSACGGLGMSVGGLSGEDSWVKCGPFGFGLGGGGAGNISVSQQSPGGIQGGSFGGGQTTFGINYSSSTYKSICQDGIYGGGGAGGYGMGYSSGQSTIVASGGGAGGNGCVVLWYLTSPNYVPATRMIDLNPLTWWVAKDGTNYDLITGALITLVSMSYNTSSDGLYGYYKLDTTYTSTVISYIEIAQTQPNIISNSSLNWTIAIAFDDCSSVPLSSIANASFIYIQTVYDFSGANSSSNIAHSLLISTNSSNSVIGLGEAGSNIFSTYSAKNLSYGVLVFVRSGYGMTIYLNGIPFGLISNKAANSGTQLYQRWGSGYSGNPRCTPFPFRASATFNRSLTANEVAQITMQMICNKV